MNPELIGGRYELLGRVGAGGMGEVYRSRDRLTEAIVALKRALHMPTASRTPSDRDLRDPSSEAVTALTAAAAPSTVACRSSEEAAVSRLALAAEFRVLSALRHPNIVSVLDYGFQANHLPFFTMEILEDAVPIDVASREKPLDFQLDLILELLQALSYLHRHGVVHRDLKPSNVLVRERRVTVLDFGIAGLPENAVAGTAGFIAPEVLEGARPTPASDFYAVGAIACQMLTGGSVRRGSVPGEGLDPFPLRNFGPVGELLAVLLARSPKKRRYSDARTLIADLARAAGRDLPPETSADRESYLRAAPLVGRRRELDLLAKSLDGALAGRGSAWLIAGESGIGKSRLLEEVRSRALVQGLLTLTARAGENQAPHALFGESVLRLALVVEVNDEEAGLLKLVFPEIERVLARPVLTAEVDPQALQERLFAVIASLFVRYGRPVLLLLEDCHHIGLSLDLMRRLSQLTETVPLMLIASFREDERPQMADECPRMRLLRMNRFSAREIQEIASSMLGPGLGGDPSIASFLQKQTEGNPFFLVEAVRELAAASGRLDKVSPEMLPEGILSGGMGDYARRRLNRLPGWAREPIRVAALIGREVDLDVLREATGLADLDALLVACGDAAILEGYGYHWRFSHDKIREMVLEQIPSADLPGLGGKAADAIEAIHAAAPDWIPAQAALWKMAGVPEKASHYLLLAAAQILSAGAPEKAVELGLDAARQLGEDLPTTRQEQGQAIGVEAAGISALLGGRRPTDLVDLPCLDDQRVARIISILMLISPAAHISQKLELFALGVLRCFSLTLRHGIGPDAPKVVAMHAAVIRELTQDSRLAHEFTQLAMDLDQKLNGRISAPVAFLHAWFVNHWIHPLKANLQHAWNGARAGLSENDLLYGCFNSAAYVMYLSFSGAPLGQVVQEADRQIARIADRVKVAAFHCRLERQVALALQGRTHSPICLSDDHCNEQRDVASICATANYNQIGYFCIAKMRLHYYYHQYEEAHRYSEQALPLLPAFQGQVGEWEFAFFRALICAARAREIPDPERAHLLGIGDKLQLIFEKWAGNNPANFDHKLNLIQAELLLSHGQPEAALAFEAAVVSAAKSGFVHDLALAHERASLFHASTQNREKAYSHAQSAIRHYEKWEAAAKSKAVDEAFLG